MYDLCVALMSWSTPLIFPLTAFILSYFFILPIFSKQVDLLRKIEERRPI